MSAAVRDFEDSDDGEGFDKVPDLEQPKLKPAMVSKDSKASYKDTTAWKIYDDIFHSGSMPLLTAYFHDYDFYPLDVEPEKLSVWEHFQVYMRHIPFLCLYYATIVLRGVGQVYICNHPVTGLCVCVGLYLSSPTLLVYALLGAVFENIGAYVVCKPVVGEVEAGLFGYDGTLVGCAVYTFLSMSETEQVPPSLDNRGMLILFVLASAVGVVHSSCVNMNNLPALTLAFNILTMAFILSLARRNSTVATLTWMVQDNSPASLETDWGDMSPAFVLDAALRGIGQFCFVGTTLGGGFVLLGIAICSRRAGYMALAGSLVSMLVCYYVVILPTAAHATIRNGIYGYNAMGTCVAVGGDVFFHSDVPNTIVALLGAALTVLMQVAIQSVLNTDSLSLPVLTCPFVLTAWMVMLSRSDWLQPLTGAGMDLDDALQMDRRHEENWYYRPEKKMFTESPERAAIRTELVRLKSLQGAGISSPDALADRILSDKLIMSGKYASAKKISEKILNEKMSSEKIMSGGKAVGGFQTPSAKVTPFDSQSTKIRGNAHPPTSLAYALADEKE